MCTTVNVQQSHAFDPREVFHVVKYRSPVASKAALKVPLSVAP